MVHMILLAHISVSLSNPHKVAAPRREARWRPPRSVLSSDFPMTTPALDSRTPMADIDALIESVDDERARAAAAMEVDEERRSKMATPIQAHARGMLARQHATRQEDSLAQKARRASAGLVDFTRSLYLELTEPTAARNFSVICHRLLSNFGRYLWRPPLHRPPHWHAPPAHGHETRRHAAPA